jgi:hypothetical protein
MKNVFMCGRNRGDYIKRFWWGRNRNQAFPGFVVLRSWVGQKIKGAVREAEWWGAVGEVEIPDFVVSAFLVCRKATPFFGFLAHFVRFENLSRRQARPQHMFA